MRFVLACSIALGFMVGSAGLVKPTVAAKNDVVAADQQPPGGQVDEVDSRADRDDDWWANPYFIGVAVSCFDTRVDYGHHDGIARRRDACD